MCPVAYLIFVSDLATVSSLTTSTFTKGTILNLHSDPQNATDLLNVCLRSLKVESETHVNFFTLKRTQQICRSSGQRYQIPLGESQLTTDIEETFRSQNPQ